MRLTAVIVVAAALMAIALMPAGAAGAGRSCAGRFHVGSPHGIELTASDIRASGLSCARARHLARQFLSKKLFGHPVEQCAAAAEMGGCDVDGFACRTPNTRPPLTSSCAAGDNAVIFTETDSDDG